MPITSASSPVFLSAYPRTSDPVGRQEYTIAEDISASKDRVRFRLTDSRGNISNTRVTVPCGGHEITTREFGLACFDDGLEKLISYTRVNPPRLETDRISSFEMQTANLMQNLDLNAQDLDAQVMDWEPTAGSRRHKISHASWENLRAQYLADERRDVFGPNGKRIARSNRMYQSTRRGGAHTEKSGEAISTWISKQRSPGAGSSRASHASLENIARQYLDDEDKILINDDGEPISRRKKIYRSTRLGGAGTEKSGREICVWISKQKPPEEKRTFRPRARRESLEDLQRQYLENADMLPTDPQDKNVSRQKKIYTSTRLEGFHTERSGNDISHWMSHSRKPEERNAHAPRASMENLAYQYLADGGKILTNADGKRISRLQKDYTSIRPGGAGTTKSGRQIASWLSKQISTEEGFRPK